MAANRDRLEVFYDWLEIFVADRAYCFGKCTSDHTSLLRSFPSLIRLCVAANQLSRLIFPESGANFENRKIFHGNVRAGRMEMALTAKK